MIDSVTHVFGSKAHSYRTIPDMRKPNNSAKKSCVVIMSTVATCSAKQNRSRDIGNVENTCRSHATFAMDLLLLLMPPVI